LGVAYFSQGQTAFNANNHEEALPYLEDALRFLTDEATQWNQLLFMIASIHYNNPYEDRLRDARVLLEELYERAPTFQAAAVRAMLDSIEEQS
jgi:hypothetical protein